MDGKTKQQVLEMVEQLGVQAEQDGFSPAAARTSPSNSSSRRCT
jgi:hypothetical protein